MMYRIPVIGRLIGFFLRAYGLSSIARSRAIRHSWLAWVPLGQMWILGSVSDDYQYFEKRRERKSRIWLFWIEVAIYPLALTATLFAAFAGTSPESVPDERWLLLAVFAIVLVLALILARQVLLYLALYDIYAAYEPQKSVLFLVLSILVASWQWIFILICMQKAPKNSSGRIGYSDADSDDPFRARPEGAGEDIPRTRIGGGWGL